MTNDITTTKNSVNTAVSILDAQSMGAMMQFAEVMSAGKFSVPQHLQNNTSDCLAITMQAMQWGMNPFAVAQKTHLVNGVLGYESQLVNAVISSSTAIDGRFRYEESDGWDNLAGKVKMAKNYNGKTVPTKNWTDNDEAKLWVRVGAVLNGDDYITWGQRVYFGNITTRNSPLWVTAPIQQLKYLALKYWARIYTPDVILGVYDKESLEQPVEQRKERDVTPAEDLNAVLMNDAPAPRKKRNRANDTVIVQDVEPEQQPETNASPTRFEVIKNYISEIKDQESYNVATSAFNDAAKNKLCTTAELEQLLGLINEKNG